jgi:hypothetical protein
MCGSNLQEAFSTSSILDCLRSFGALGLLCIGTSTSTTAELSSKSSASFGASIVLHRRRRIDPVSGIAVGIIPSGCNSLSIVRAKLCLLKKMVMTHSYLKKNYYSYKLRKYCYLRESVTRLCLWWVGRLFLAQSFWIAWKWFCTAQFSGKLSSSSTFVSNTYVMLLVSAIV